MKILCPVKFTPDVDAFVYDYEKKELVREGNAQIINPDDACAMGFALKLKKAHPETEIEIVTMAPLSVLPSVRDIARRGIDRVTVLSDPQLAGSDTLATARVLAAYIRRGTYDAILTGCRSLDGDTGHIPAELAGLLGLECLSGIVDIDEVSFLSGSPKVTVDTELETLVFWVPLPAVLGISAKSGIRLPFVRYADLDLDVEDRISVFSAADLGLSSEDAGQIGSATKVVRTYTESYPEKQERIFVKGDEEGVETVYRFLKEKGYL